MEIHLPDEVWLLILHNTYITRKHVNYSSTWAFIQLMDRYPYQMDNSH